MCDAQEIGRICKVMSAATRVRILELLKHRVLCVGAISARLDVTQGAVSQHLRVLRDVELVAAEKRGYYVHYRLNRPALAKWKRLMGRFLQARAVHRRPTLPQCGAKRKRLCVRKTGAVRSRRN